MKTIVPLLSFPHREEVTLLVVEKSLQLKTFFPILHIHVVVVPVVLVAADAAVLVVVLKICKTMQSLKRG